MQTSDISNPTQSTSYFVATVLLNDGTVKHAYGEASDQRDFESTLLLLYPVREVIWQHALKKPEHIDAKDMLLKVAPATSPDELKAEKFYERGTADARLYSKQIIKCLDAKKDIMYIAAGPILICPDLILHLQVGCYSHYNSKDYPTSQDEGFVTGIIGHVVRKKPNYRVLEVSGGGIRKGQGNKGFGYTCKHHLANFTDVRYQHSGRSQEETHLIRSHVFLFWQMMREISPYAVNLDYQTNTTNSFPKTDLDALLKS